MKRHILKLILLIIIITSCNSSKVFISDTKPKEIDSIGLYHPIVLINKNERKDHLDDPILSNIAWSNIMQGIDTVIPLRIAIFDIDDNRQKQTDKILYTVMDLMSNSKTDEAKEASTSLFRSLEAGHINYALGIVLIGSSSGETERPTPKLATELGKSFMSWSYLSCVILDVRKKNIAFYKRSNYDHTEPCVKKTTTEQLRKIFQGYFY
jgi:hypothetical protein